jgi:hypothetical protein
MTSATEASVEEQFTVGEGAELSISNIAGRVAIRAGDSGIILLRAVKHGRESAVERTRVETRQDGNRVTVRTRAEEGDGFPGFNRGVSAVDYDLEVPPGCAAEVKTVSADVIVRGTGGSLRLETVSGDAEVEDISGSCSITTVSGDVDARNVSAPLTTRTTSGDITMRDSAVSSVNAHSVSGNLTLDSPLSPDGQYYGKTVSGDMTLNVPGDTGATVEMHTVSGSHEVDLPVEVIRAGRRHFQARINGGGARVEMHSVSGDLRLRASSPPPARASRSSEEHDAAVSDALSALERGEISVEEAMSRIKGAR